MNNAWTSFYREIQTADKEKVRRVLRAQPHLARRLAVDRQKVRTYKETRGGKRALMSAPMGKVPNEAVPKMINLGFQLNKKNMCYECVVWLNSAGEQSISSVKQLMQEMRFHVEIMRDR